MANILLDYVFPVTSIEPTPAASTAFLKQILVVAKPKDGGVTTGVITLCTTMTAVTALLGANAVAEVQQIFNAGQNRVYILPMASLNIATAIAGHESDFNSIVISSDFVSADVTAADFGVFKGVVGVSSTDDTFLGTQAAIANRSAWHTTTANKAKNMFFAFGKLVSNASNWTNQQYITMPFGDDVVTNGQADALFAAKVSFVIQDDQYGSRLGLFVAGGKAITANYIKRNLQIDLQSKALQFLSGNQPAYTLTQAALLEDELKKVMNLYIDTLKWIDKGTIAIKLIQDNFVANGYINIAEPRALWRINAEMRASL